MSNKYIRNMTEQVVSYMDLPSEEKRKRKQAQKAKKEESKLTKWFGVLPLAIRISFRKH